MTIYEEIASTGVMNPLGIAYEEFESKTKEVDVVDIGLTGIMDPVHKRLDEFDPLYF